MWGKAQLHSFAWGNPLVTELFVEKNISLPIQWSWHSVEKSITIDIYVYSWAFNSIPFYICLPDASITLSWLLLFVVSFYIRRNKFSSFVFFQIVLAIMVPLRFQINLGSACTFTYKLAGIAIETALNKEICLMSIAFFTILNLLIYEDEMCLPLSSSLIS